MHVAGIKGGAGTCANTAVPLPLLEQEPAKREGRGRRAPHPWNARKFSRGNTKW